MAGNVRFHMFSAVSLFAHDQVWKTAARAHVLFFRTGKRKQPGKSSSHETFYFGQTS